jgi:Mg2+ and Co2+ transporter CorA
MDVRLITPTGVEECAWSDVPDLLKRRDGVVWVDVLSCDQAKARELADAFSFHDLAQRDIVERHHLPKLHAYPDHLFLVLHAPEPADAGHIHLVELDQFVGKRYLVTTHGPVAPGVTDEVALRETRHVVDRLKAGKLTVRTPFELSYALVSAVAHRQSEELSRLASKIAGLEQKVRDDIGDPIRVLEEMFLVRHELLTIRTMAAESAEIFARMSSLSRMIPEEAPPLIRDVIDRFERVSHMCDGEKEFVQGVIDFYQARTTTKMNVAMERLALIAAVLLPVTAIASIYGMNIIVGDHTDLPQLGIVLVVMGLVAGGMLAWSKRLGWW